MTMAAFHAKYPSTIPLERVALLNGVSHRRFVSRRQARQASGQVGVLVALAVSTVAVPRPAFGALRHRNFRLFLGGQFVSLSGTWMQTVAQGWLVLQLTKSAFQVGLVTTINTLPVLLFTLYGGVVADRVNKRRFLLTLQTLMLLEALALALLTATGRVTVGWVMVLAASQGLLAAFEIPARQSFLVEMTGHEDLMTAIALNSSVFNVTRVIGPAIAGVVIATVGIAACFFVNAASYLAVLWMLAIMRPPFAGTSATSAGRSTFGDGWRYVMHTAEPRLLTLLTITFSVFGFSFAPMLPGLRVAGARGRCHRVWRPDVRRRRGCCGRRVVRGSDGSSGTAGGPGVRLRDALRLGARGNQPRRPVRPGAGIAHPGGMCMGADQHPHQHPASDEGAGSPARTRHGILFLHGGWNGAPGRAPGRVGVGAFRRADVACGGRGYLFDRGPAGMAERAPSRRSCSGINSSPDGLAMLITISRQFGAGGSLVAEHAARALGWRVVDNDFVARVAARAGMPEATVAMRDERAPGFREWLLRALSRAAPELIAPPTPLPPAEREEAALVRVTESVVADLAAEGRVVLVGRAAPAVLSRTEAALHVRVIAPRADRIRAVMGRHTVGLAEAERLMDDTDRNRQRYHREYYDRDWADPAHYHLVLNTGLLGYGGAGDVVVDRVRRLGWAGESVIPIESGE